MTRGGDPGGDPGGVPGGSEAAVAGRGRDPMLVYLLPAIGFGLGNSIEARLDPPLYPIAYAAKLLLVTLLLYLGRAAWRDLRPWPRPGVLALAAALGAAVTAIWVGLDGLYPVPAWLGRRTGFDPATLAPALRYPFLAVRLAGLVVIVPVLEELLWRSFVVRVVQDADFTRVPVGRVTPLAALVSAAGFALTHVEWLPALITGLAWAWLLARTRSLAACVVSHGVANLLLAGYVLATGSYRFW